MGQKESTSVFTKSLYNNQAAFELYYYHLGNLALSMFEWIGLPPSVNARFIEASLMEFGAAAFIEAPTLGYIATRVTAAGMVDIYGEPIAYKCYSVNGIFSQDFKKQDMVLIRNNATMIPTIRTIQFYAARLADLEMTISVNLATQKKPWVILVNEKQRFSWEQFMMKVEGNQSMVMGTKELDLEAVKYFGLNSPYLTDKLQQAKESIINDFYTRMGLNNANTDKRERMIVDEVNANNEVIALNYLTMLQTRQEACKLINEKYGLKVSVRLRTKGELDGEVHNDDQDPQGNDPAVRSGTE